MKDVIIDDINCRLERLVEQLRELKIKESHLEGAFDSLHNLLLDLQHKPKFKEDQQ